MKPVKSVVRIPYSKNLLPIVIVKCGDIFNIQTTRDIPDGRSLVSFAMDEAHKFLSKGVCLVICLEAEQGSLARRATGLL